jgi:hypothetical protein
LKSLKQIRTRIRFGEAKGGLEAYQKYFKSILKRFGVDSPSELDDDKKKKFYDAIDAGWEGDSPEDKKDDKKESVIHERINPGQRRKITMLAKKHSGDMERAIKEIEKMKRGLSDDKEVMDILKKANEDVVCPECGGDGCSHCGGNGYHSEGQVNEVRVDIRTRGFKSALSRLEKAKEKREAKKISETDKILAAANKALAGEGPRMSEDMTADGSVESGNIEYPEKRLGKKKKKEAVKKFGDYRLDSMEALQRRK